MSEVYHKDTASRTNSSASNVSSNDTMSLHQPQTGLLSPTHPSNPRSWPLLKKLYVSSAALLYTGTLFFALTCWGAATARIPETLFHVSHLKGTMPFSVFLLGIAAAPMFTPHLSERFGRQYLYPASTVLMSIFLIATAYAPNFNGIIAFRFIAGLFGGPIMVLVEGTFADLWSPRHTITWYPILACGEYLGSSIGPLIITPVISTDLEKWRYTQYIPLMLCAVALIYGAAMPETFARVLARRGAHKKRTSITLPPAPSGETVSEMIRTTVADPFLMLISEPLLIPSAFVLGLNFAVFYGWFIGIPFTLGVLFNSPPNESGIVWLFGIAATAFGVTTTLLLHRLVRPVVIRFMGTHQHGVPVIEDRLIPSIFGCFLMYAGYQWLGWTANPSFNVVVHVAGDAMGVAGQTISLMSTLSYLFDAYPRARAELSALTSLSVWRHIVGGVCSMFFLPGLLYGKGGAPIYFNYQCQMLVPLFWWPWFMMLCGPYLRSTSRFNKGSKVDDSALGRELAFKEAEKSFGA